MNDSDLDKLLKSARPPERSSEQWTVLARRISARLHWQPRETDESPTPRRPRFPAWALGLAGVGVAVVLATVLWPDRKMPTTASNGKPRPLEFRLVELRKMFPNQIRAIILSATDARIELAETANQPDSQPIYLKVCGPDGCKQVITFSGRHIRLNGEDWEVLANGTDGVIVTGEKSVWSSSEPSRQLSHFSIEARQIKSS